MDSMTIQILIRPIRLIDGSFVYDVRISALTGYDLTMCALTEADAHALADKLAAAINDHTTDRAEVR